MKTNLLDQSVPLRFGPLTLSRSDFVKALTWTVPAAIAALVFAGLNIALYLSAQTALAQQQARYAALSAQAVPATTQTQVADQARQLHDVRALLADAHASVNRRLGPLVALANALPADARLSAVNDTANSLVISGDARNYYELLRAQRQLAMLHIPLNITSTNDAPAYITWNGSLAEGPR